MFRCLSKRLATRNRCSRRLLAESLESRALMAANPLGVTPTDTGEFLLGRVVVTPVLFESDGSLDTNTQNWSASEIDDFLVKVGEATDWWSETLAQITDRHELEFVIDSTFATTPFETQYEPIDRSSEGFLLYGRDFLNAQGLEGVRGFQDAVYLFNHAQREKYNADWAFTIFVADASDEPDGTFASGGAFSGAFAYAGGQFIVMPSTRPASTITHEMGHIFWARDEYPGGSSWDERRGYYDTQNTNAADNPTSGFVQEISIMRGGGPLQEAYASHTSPASTLAMLGWQDSDGDGVFDLADVPLDLQAIGSFDPVTSTYRLRGSASAVPLINQNSAGNQSDITLNRISRIEYSLDDGLWQVAESPDAQVVESFDVSVSVQEFSSIRWRVIDAVTGITSEVIEGTPTTPALSSASWLGFAFLDADVDDVRDASESMLAGVTLTLASADGSPLIGGRIDAAKYGDVEIQSTNGSTLASVSQQGLETPIFSFESSLLDGKRVFKGFDNRTGEFTDAFTESLAFVAEFDSPIGDAELQITGLSPISYGRIEAYNLNGDLIQRVTSDRLLPGESTSLSITDSLGRISSIKAFGHIGSRIAISELTYGATTTLATDSEGAFRFPNLPLGTYQLSILTENVTQAPEFSTVSFDVTGAVSSLQPISIRSVDSPFYNTELAEDVNRDGSITAADALGVILDLNLHQARVIGHDEVPTLLVDVNNDGRVSALDALTVVNWLNLNDASGGGQVGGEQFGSGGAFARYGLPTRQDTNSSRDVVLAGWGDPADYGFGSASNEDQKPDRRRWSLTEDSIKSGDLRSTHSSHPDRRSERDWRGAKPAKPVDFLNPNHLGQKLKPDLST